MANPNPKRQNLRPKPWKKGQSGNPKGYSKGRRLTDGLLALIDSKQADEAIAEIALQQILAGNFRFYKFLLELTEGKVADVVNIDDISLLSDEQLLTIAGRDSHSRTQAKKPKRG